ncbi:probable G-protein coupled receptor No9 [Branchiostoma floridae]|uniref:Probable G-protein coupled receptor No9 n=1 Tax=Branchiostoma floridae TaxID=7739 RepID=A0A9J7KIL8_BRAFL|nr:probable G-protein coupled receptor No9 [Branchiostoma floridae]
MALSGFGLSVICEPITLLGLIDGGTALKDSTVLCMINGLTSAIFPLLTTLLLTLISIDRYLAICKPHAAALSRRRLKITLAVIWLFSVLVGLPPLVGWSKYEYHQGTFHCSPDWTVLSYRLTCIFLGLAVPSLAIFYCYTAIFKFVRRNHRKLKAWRDRGTEAHGSAALQTTVEPSKRLSPPRRLQKGNATAPLDETGAVTDNATVGLHKNHDIECQLSSCHSQDAEQVDLARDEAKQQPGTTTVEQQDIDLSSNLNTCTGNEAARKSDTITNSPVLRQENKPRETQAFLTIVKSTRHGSFDQIRGEPSQLTVEQSEFVTEGFPSRTIFTTQTSRDTFLVPGRRRRVLDNIETSRKKDRKDRENHKIQRKIALSAVIYIGSHFACWGPYVIIVGGGYDLPLWVQTLVMWLAYSSTIVCPVVYALNNRKILQETLVMWLAYSSTIVCPVVYALNNRKILQEVRRAWPCGKTSG